MAKDDDADLGDGTQAAAFGDALSDPVSSDSADDFKLTRVASPVKPDPKAVRDLVDAEMAREQQGGTAKVEPASESTPPPASEAKPIPPAAPLGALPRQRSRAGLRGSLKMPKMPRIPRPQPGAVRRVKPSSGFAGVLLALVLMIAFVVLAIEFLVSLISSITGLFS